MSRRRRERDPLAAELEALTGYLTRRYVREEVLAGLWQLLCDMARAGRGQGSTVVDTPWGPISVAAVEEASQGRVKYYRLQASLPDGSSAAGHALMKKVAGAAVEVWELSEVDLLNIRHPGSGVDLAPCIAEASRACLVAAWWPFPLLFFVIWPSLLVSDIFASAANIYYTLLGIAVLSGVVCRNLGGALALGVGGVVGAFAILFLYTLLSTLLPALPLAPIGQEAAWTAYLLALALLYGVAAYLSSRL